MNIYIICGVPAQIPYLGKFWFLYLENKSIKQPDFLHVDTNSHKLNVDKKILVGYGQKWVWPVWSWDSKIDCFSRMN